MWLKVFSREFLCRPFVLWEFYIKFFTSARACLKNLLEYTNGSFGNKSEKVKPSCVHSNPPLNGLQMIITNPASVVAICFVKFTNWLEGAFLRYLEIWFPLTGLPHLSTQRTPIAYIRSTYCNVKRPVAIATDIEIEFVTMNCESWDSVDFIHNSYEDLLTMIILLLSVRILQFIFYNWLCFLLILNLTSLWHFCINLFLHQTFSELLLIFWTIARCKKQVKHHEYIFGFTIFRIWFLRKLACKVIREINALN